eukprot:3104105-Rhodomonas_salina.1
MPCPVLRYGAMDLRGCYAMPRTDVAHPRTGTIRLRGCYAVPGTEIGYGGTSGDRILPRSQSAGP